MRKKRVNILEYALLDLLTQRDALWFRPHVSARLSLFLFAIFLRNCSLDFFDFVHDVRASNYQKLMESDSLGKFLFTHVWAKETKNGPKREGLP